MSRTPFALALIITAALVAPASAYVYVAGGSLAGACYEHARNDLATQEAIDQCSTALSGALNPRNRAATYINRGIIHLNRRDFEPAMADFDAAIRVQPRLAEGYVNRGAALLRQRDYSGAITAISQGLELNPADPAQAYYNRGVAHEELGQLRAAYDDYRRASQLEPGWRAPQLELARFRVG